MKQKWGLVLAAVALLFAAPAQAQDVTINGEATTTVQWVNATQYENGAALDPADIDSVILYYGPTSRDGRGCTVYPESTTDTTCYPLITEVTADGATSTGITLALDQTTTFYFAGVTNVGGVLSAYSVESPITFELVIDQSRPMPPTGIVIEAVITCETSDASVSCRFDVT